METTNNETLKIEIKDLVKIYKRGSVEVVALRGLTAKFYSGEITVIEGPSGCGKTTLINLIGGLDRQSAGKILIHGKNGSNEPITNIGKLNNRELELFRKKRVGIVFQFMNLIPSLTAEENVCLPLLLSGYSLKEQKEISQKMLERTKISERSKHKPGELSGGEQQRIAIAAAIVNDPDIIIADEPTGELDSVTREEILDLFRDLIDKYPNKCLIIVSHDRAVERIADRILTIKDGVIIRERLPGENLDEEEGSEILKQKLYKYQDEIAELKEKLNSINKIISKT